MPPVRSQDQLFYQCFPFNCFLYDCCLKPNVYAAYFNQFTQKHKEKKPIKSHYNKQHKQRAYKIYKICILYKKSIQSSSILNKAKKIHGKQILAKEMNDKIRHVFFLNIV